MTISTFGQGHYQTVRLGDLVTDGRFNRPISQAHVERLRNDLKPEAFGSIILWERDPGEFVILDGQHRVRALIAAGVAEDSKCIPAIVHSDLTLSMASMLFVLLNQSKLVSSYDKYRALLTAGDPTTGEIDRIVRAQGLEVGVGGRDGVISAVEALRQIHALGEPKGAVLATTLATLHAAWNENSEAYRSAVLRGLGLYFHAHRDARADDVAVALIKGPGAAINLIGWAKQLAGTQRMPLDRAIAQVMETAVMKRRGRPQRKNTG